jgi:hypothetical protein
MLLQATAEAGELRLQRQERCIRMTHLRSS